MVVVIFGTQQEPRETMCCVEKEEGKVTCCVQVLEGDGAIALHPLSAFRLLFADLKSRNRIVL